MITGTFFSNNEKEKKEKKRNGNKNPGKWYTDERIHRNKK